MAKLTHIFRYPIKSSAAQPLESVEVGPLGLAGDRRWMLIDQASGKFITGRENGILVQLQIEYSQHAADYSQMRLMWPGGMPVHATATQTRREVQIWGTRVDAAIAENSANQALSAWLGRAVELVFFDADSSRQLDQKYARPEDQTAFADGFPVLLCTQSSLNTLNNKLEAPVPMLRFRPNLVVDGDYPPHVEDSWQQIRIGDAIFDVAKPCVRCVFTTVDPNSGERDPSGEPLNTLKTYRRSEKGICFGVNLITRAPRVHIRRNDALEIVR